MQLNVEQKKIINNKPMGHTLLRGVAGSGKTTVAVNRIPFLVDNYCIDKDDKVLMVTYNKTLINYIKYVYEKTNEEKAAEQLSIFSSNHEDKVEIRNIDSIIYTYYNTYKKLNNKSYQLITDTKKRQNILNQSILEMSKLHSDVKVLDVQNSRFLKEEIDWIKACNYMEIEEYQNVDRIGRMGQKNADGPQKLIKNSPTRRAIFELMQHYTKNLIKNDFIDFPDMALIALKQAKVKPLYKFTHILIDESQDLSKVQLEFLRCMYNEKSYSSIMFVADTAQSIYPSAWLVKGRSFTTIGFDMTGKSNALAKNYRTTTQIAEAAYSLIENDTNIVDDDNFVKPSLIDKQGSYPIFKSFENSKEENQYLADLVNDTLLKKYNLCDIAIVARLKNQLIETEETLKACGIAAKVLDTKESMDFKENNLKLLTMHSIKGLEFKVIIIVGLSSKVFPYRQSGVLMEDGDLLESNERKLLYVGMTRATEMLYLSANGEISKFISQINGKYLTINEASAFKCYYPISAQNYLFKDKIIDLYSNEEKVRQWIIRELIDNYKYPDSLIDVEYKVNLFSRVGLVDIAVLIHKNKTKIPYIFIEVKRKSHGIQQCIEQLKSYMSVNSECQYGIATDGSELRIINRNFELIDDIPRFNSSMLPSSIETFEYYDFTHKKKIEFLRDRNKIDEIIVDTQGAEEEYNENNMYPLNIYSDIAAGVPIEMNSDVQDIFYLPTHWLQNSNESFILKVKGDSMIDAGVNDGDYVIIKKQSVAESRDIVAVDIDGNATLKRFVPMGDTIFFMPENKDYEPIQVKADQARIIGVAVGSVKRRM